MDDPTIINDDNNNNQQQEKLNDNKNKSREVICKGCHITFASKNALFRHLHETDGICLKNSGNPNDYEQYIQYSSSHPKAREKCIILYGYIIQSNIQKQFQDTTENENDTNVDNENANDINDNGSKRKKRIVRNGNDVAEIVAYIIEQVCVDECPLRIEHKINRSYGHLSHNTNIIKQENYTSAITELLTLRLPILDTKNISITNNTTTTNNNQNNNDQMNIENVGSDNNNIIDIGSNRIVEEWIQKVNDALNQYRVNDTKGLIDITVFGRQSNVVVVQNDDDNNNNENGTNVNNNIENSDDNNNDNSDNNNNNNKNNKKNKNKNKNKKNNEKGNNNNNKNGNSWNRFNPEMDFTHRRMEYIVPADFLLHCDDEEIVENHVSLKATAATATAAAATTTAKMNTEEKNRKQQQLLHQFWKSLPVFIEGPRQFKLPDPDQQQKQQENNYFNWELPADQNMTYEQMEASFPRPDKDTLALLTKWKRFMQLMTTNNIQITYQEAIILQKQNEIYENQQQKKNDDINSKKKEKKKRQQQLIQQHINDGGDEKMEYEHQIVNNDNDLNNKNIINIECQQNDNHTSSEVKLNEDQIKTQSDHRQDQQQRPRKNKTSNKIHKKIRIQNEKDLNKTTGDDNNNNNNKVLLHILKRKRYHNFTSTVMAHEYLAYRRLDRFYHRATIRPNPLCGEPYRNAIIINDCITNKNFKNSDTIIPNSNIDHNLSANNNISNDPVSKNDSVDMIDRNNPVQQRPFIVLSLSGDLFLTGQVCHLVALFIAIVHNIIDIDIDIIDCIFDEKYPHLIPTPSMPTIGLYSCDVYYTAMEGKLKTILSPRITDRYLNGWNYPMIVQRIQSYQNKMRHYIANVWESSGTDSDGNLSIKNQWMEQVLCPWAERARKQLHDYRIWKQTMNPQKSNALSSKTDLDSSNVHADLEANNENQHQNIAQSLPSLDGIDPTVPSLYEKVLFYLREADSSGKWPSTTPKRQLVMVSSRIQSHDEDNGKKITHDGSDDGIIEKQRSTNAVIPPPSISLAEAHLKAKSNHKADLDSAYAYAEGQGGASGSFSVGAMPGIKCIQPKANTVFPELMKAAFELEIALFPNREPSSTIAINRNAQFRPHTDSGAGAGQSTSLIVGLGTYSGGELLVENVSHDIRYQPIEFDGWKQRHWTMPFIGERYSLVWFTPKGCEGVRGIDLCQV